MGVYSCRSLVAGACTCVSELAASSVHSLGETGGLSLSSVVALEEELAKERALAVRRLSPFNTAPPVEDDGTQKLSAGGTACTLGAALNAELGVLVGTSLSCARSARELASEAAALLVVPELKTPLAALQETLDAFEAGLAVDASEVRATLSEALRNLLPVCTLLQPPPESDAAPAAAAVKKVTAPGAAPTVAPAAAPTDKTEELQLLASQVASEAIATAVATVDVE